MRLIDRIRGMIEAAAISGTVVVAGLGLSGLVGLAGCGDEDRPSGNLDLSPPSITLLAPADSAVISAPRSIEFRARASDNVGIRVVVFYFDGAQVGEDAEGLQNLYSYLWQTEPLAAGPHQGIAKAFDWANLTGADTVTVIVE